jgi:iron complex outermembrane recepter protein
MKECLRNRLQGGVSVGAIVLATALSMSAQAQAPAAAASDLVLEEIVVTGSRIARPAEQSPVPVTSVNSEVLELRGTTSVSEILSRIPALQATPGVGDTANGRVAVNLRGLGIDRTLVLVNGRRHVGGVQGSGAVDIQSIPSALIDRVDVLTGGASAVYGADAVTGVVNFVMKKDYEGTEVTAQVTTPEESGGGIRKYASATVGRNFDNGKGNVVLSVSATDQDSLEYGKRDFSRDNGIDDDVANPALFVQAADITPAMRTAGITPGQRILSLNAAQTASLTPSLLDRARSAPARAFVANQRFALSSIYGIIGFDPRGTGLPLRNTDALTPTNDLDGNGVADCQQSWPSRNRYGCYVVDPVTGRVRPFQDGTFANNDQSGGDGTPDTLNRAHIVSAFETYSADLNVRYEVSPYFKPFLESKVARTKARNVESTRTFDDYIQIRLDNPFIPDALRQIANAQIAANPALANTYQFIVTRDHADIVDPVVTSERKTYRVVGGFEGEFDNGWTYELAYNWGRTVSEDIRPNRLNDRFFSAIDAVRAPNGQIVCRSSLNPTAIPRVSDFPVFTFTGFNTFSPTDGSCRPLNIFGLEAPSAEARAFVTTQNARTSTITQQVFSGVLSGDSADVFELPGGPVQFATGFEYRKEESDYKVSEFERRGFTDRGGEQPVKGDYDVTEGFAEINLPLLADLPLVDLLSADAAYRYGDYSTVGTVSAWKVGGVYAPVRDLRVRGGFSRTVRAPNIFELFQPTSSALFNVIDPCDAAQIGTGANPANRRANCAADGIPNGWLDPRTSRVIGTTGGNLKLTEETSDSYTVGVVLRPSFLDGFSATVDYWNIKIEDAISNVAAQDILNACYDGPRGNAFCSQLSRNRTTTAPTFLAVNSLNQTRVNFAKFEASGVDFDVLYRFDLENVGLEDAGKLTFSATGTWMQKNRSFQSARDANAVNSQLEERANPKWSVNPSVSWSLDGFTVSWFGFWQSRQTLPGVETETQGNFTPSFASPFWVHDASVRYEVNEELTISGGVNNIANIEPSVNEISRPASALGRTWYVRAKYAF